MYERIKCMSNERNVQIIAIRVKKELLLHLPNVYYFSSKWEGQISIPYVVRIFYAVQQFLNVMTKHINSSSNEIKLKLVPFIAVSCSVTGHHCICFKINYWSFILGNADSICKTNSYTTKQKQVTGILPYMLCAEGHRHRFTIFIVM